LLSPILSFAIMAVFLYIGQGGFGTTIQPTPAQTDIAKQLVTTLSTLVVAIASFYVGSTTVREARSLIPKALKAQRPHPRHQRSNGSPDSRAITLLNVSERHL
jgi:hypothetical protein